MAQVDRLRLPLDPDLLLFILGSLQVGTLATGPESRDNRGAEVPGPAGSTARHPRLRREEFPRAGLYFAAKAPSSFTEGTDGGPHRAGHWVPCSHFWVGAAAEPKYWSGRAWICLMQL